MLARSPRLRIAGGEGRLEEVGVESKCTDLVGGGCEEARWLNGEWARGVFTPVVSIVSKVVLRLT